MDVVRFKEIIDSFYKHLKHLQEIENQTAGIKLAEDKWSLKEIIGHLIDSASNNHQRFVRLQFGDLLGFPAYEGEEWVWVQQYNSMDWDTLVTLWYSYNCLLLKVIDNIGETALVNVWVKDEEVIPLEELISDYFRHMELHIDHFHKRLKELKEKG